MMVSVRLAFFCVGSRKAVTPFDTASTPVIAVHPRGCDDWRGVAAGGDGADGSDDDHEKQRPDEEVRGDEEGRAGVLDSAHIDERENQQDREAEAEGVGLEARDCGHEGTNAGGYADGRIQDVVDHERGGGEQPRLLPEILGGDGVAATPVRVGIDGLAVGEEDDREQADDREGDGDDLLDACEAERDEQGEGGFGAVSGGA